MSPHLNCVATVPREIQNADVTMIGRNTAGQRITISLHHSFTM